MQFVRSFPYFTSGSMKNFSQYSNCFVNSVTEFYTANDKHMMKVIINDGEMVVGQFCQEIIDYLKDAEGTYITFFFYDYSKNGRMIACIPAIWGLKLYDLDTMDIQ